MKQVIFSISNGELEVVNVPSPKISPNNLLIRSKCSLLSTGTEKMLLNFGNSNWIKRGLDYPEKVKEAIQKIKTDGPIETINAIKSKLDNPISLGYCNVGIVEQIGKNITKFKVGDRVVSNSPHAEFATAPEHLCTLIPHNIPDEEAVFTIIGSIGLQGIRLAKPSFGETFLVIGLGLIGICTAQLLKANGCKVLGIDPDKNRCDLAKSLGIEAIPINENVDVDSWCKKKTNHIGVDGVLITAATSSNEPINISSKVCRKLGRIILIGVTGLEFNRDLIYKKEIKFQVSCSYGPGRYDKSYEDNTIDYPVGYVRWTLNRNFEAILGAISSGSLITKDLISETHSINDAVKAYKSLLENPESLGIILKYDNLNKQTEPTIFLNYEKNRELKNTPINPSISFIGAGNYASRILIPVFKKCKANLYAISASKGLSPTFIGKKFGFIKSTTDSETLFSDNECNTIVIATRHDSHASIIKKSLEAGKNIFVEKPLCINNEELIDLQNAYKFATDKFNREPLLMVGYNRRFSPLISELKRNLDENQPSSFIYLCNAGFISKEHWTQDPNIGGGRLIGEACHFIDLIRFLASSPIVSLTKNFLSNNSNNDTFSLNLTFKNGSVGTIHYFSNGSKSFPKERLEVFNNGKIMTIENFKKLNFWGFNNKKNKRLFKQDKGQIYCVEKFLQAIKKGQQSPIPINEIFEVQNWILKK